MGEEGTAGVPQATAEQDQGTAQPGAAEPVVGQPAVEGDATGKRPDTAEPEKDETQETPAVAGQRPC